MSNDRRTPAKMAQVLAETVAEISDEIVCRRSLGFAGFTDEQITLHMAAAQRLARTYRAIEIERLYLNQYGGRWRFNGC